MLSVFFYMLLALVCLILGAGIMFISYLFFDYFRRWSLKRKVPKDKGKDGLADGGDVEVNIKEVKQDEERKQFRKFREFEKLRQISNEQRTRTGANSGNVSRNEQLYKRQLFPFASHNRNERNEHNDEQHKQRVKLHRPDDI